MTFTSWTDDLTLEREGFGERFLNSERIDSIHVISRDNRWWQYEETLNAMAGVRAATAGYARTVTYGFSMGAYAAVRLAGVVGADVVLALSPQFSILPSVSPFEHRWIASARTLRPVWEATLPPPKTSEAYLVYDPGDLDAGHTTLFARWAFSFTPVELRGSGHQTATFLHEVNLLKPLVRAVAAGKLDVGAFKREAWRRRRRSPQHLLTLAERVHAPEARVVISRRALALIPASPILNSRLGDALAGAGRLSEALQVHDRALLLSPEWPPVVISQARTLAATGEVAAAVEKLRALAARTGDPSHALAAADLDARRTTMRRGRRRRALRFDPGVRVLPDAPSVEVAADEVGCVLCGPHLVLRPGRYEVTFGVVVRDAPRGWRALLPAVALEVSLSSGPRLVRRVLSTRALERAWRGQIAVPFVLTERAACEFRLFTRGGTALIIDPARSLRRVGPLT